MEEKQIVWIQTEIKTPPFSEKARIQAGTLLRRLQYGEKIGMPHSKPMGDIENNCHELRIYDSANKIYWRIIYYLSSDAIVILDAFQKKSNKTPQTIIRRCKERLKTFHEDSQEDI